jgi:hypothetical protein
MPAFDASRRKEYIQDAIKMMRGDVVAHAPILGLSRSTPLGICLRIAVILLMR